LFTTDDPAVPSVNFQIPLAEARNRAINDFERQYLKELIAHNKGKINKSAEEAGISTRQLHKLMTKYGIHKEDYKA
jgi:DNA-binding NtrC family response regulator